jgi:hypothetical protein
MHTTRFGIIFFNQAQMNLAKFGYPVQTLWFYCSQNLEFFGFPIFDFERT